MKRSVVVALITTLSLSGCAAGTTEPQTAPTTSPTASTDHAEKSCNEFSNLTKRVSELVVKIWTDDEVQPSDDAELTATGAKFDTMALSAEGEVSDRIEAVAKITLETTPIVMSTKPDEYFAALESVQRACAAEGVDIGIGTWK